MPYISLRFVSGLVLAMILVFFCWLDAPNASRFLQNEWLRCAISIFFACFIDRKTTLYYLGKKNRIILAKVWILIKNMILIIYKILNMIDIIYIKYRYRLYHYVNNQQDRLWSWLFWAIYTKGKYKQVNFKITRSSVYLNQFLKTTWGLQPQRNSL